MKLLRIKKHALMSLILIGTLAALLAPIGTVHATRVFMLLENHPASTFRDPSGTVDGYLIGQTVNWHIHLNVTTSVAPFPWLSIEGLTITDALPNLFVGGPLYMSYVSGSQNSSSAAGPATFTDFHNGTLLWNFGHGPFTTGVIAPPPFSDPTEYYQASITFNATINSNVPNNTYLINTGVAAYTETASQVHSAPSVTDTIYAVASPGGVHDVAVTNVASNKTVVCRGFNANINVTVANQGNFTETFNVTAYANTTTIGSENVTLPAGNSMTATLTWNTTGFDYGNYTLSAYAWSVPGETNTANNNFTDGLVIVSIVGDITGPNGWPDGLVDMRDVGYVASRFLAEPGKPLWDPNADINGDFIIDMADVGTAAAHFMESYP